MTFRWSKDIVRRVSTLPVTLASNGTIRRERKDGTRVPVTPQINGYTATLDITPSD